MYRERMQYIAYLCDIFEELYLNRREKLTFMFILNNSI